MEYELTYELTYSNLSEGWGEGGGGCQSYLQRVCKVLFLIRTLVKTNSNLMCGSL